MTEREQKLLNLFISMLKEVGVSDGTRGWIEHLDEDGTLRRDTLSFEGEIIFGFEAIKFMLDEKDARIKELEGRKMSLLEKIKADQLAARKARDAAKVSTLTTLLSDSMRPGKDDGDRESTDAEVIAVVRSFLKKNSENMSIAGDRRDSDWCDRLDAERAVLESYLPKQMSQEEILATIQGQPLNKGAIMGFLKNNYAGLFDGKTAAAAVDTYIAINTAG